MKIKAVFVICLVYIGAYVNAEIEDPPFLEGPDTDFVTFGPINPSFGQIIELRENVTRPVIIAKVNYEGSGELKAVFTTPNEDMLDLSFKRSDDNKWNMFVNNVQDFEVEKMRRYELQVLIKGELNGANMLLTIEDIDDTKPTLLANQPECIIEENKKGETDCTYSVSDPEGVTNLKYEILEEDQREYFKVVFVPETGGTKKGKFIIEVIKELDYETTSFHMFTLNVTDPGDNEAKADVTVKVKDMPDMLPFWTTIVLSVNVKENAANKLKVSAKDGDLMVNAEINYKQGKGNYTEHFTIDKITGDIDIFPIDREELDQDIIDFNIIAYEKDNVTSQIDATIVVLVEDINDNRPIINVNSSKKEISEQTVESNIVQMEISDADTGINAQFTVSLEDHEGNGKNWFEAFEVVPAEGYKQGLFSVNVKAANKDKLDYDKDDKWRNIKLKVIVTEKEGTHQNESIIEFTLQNLNDNTPKFDDKSKQDVDVLESVKKGELIKKVLATDDDAEDSVLYSLLGSINDILEINDEGEITTKKDNVFDYESQTDIIVQVKAVDTLDDLANTRNSEIITFTIKVQDVNDEQPKIQPIESGMTIKENTTGEIVVKIQATDPDQEPDLEFSIDWEKSKATKLGTNVDKTLFENCLKIETTSIEGDKRNVEGTFKTGSKIIDYEKFDVLLLNVVITDKAQKVGKNQNTGTVFINIIDINDNAPEFDVAITGESKKVKDAAEKDTLIGSVLATDDDGPDYNTVTYSIKERNDTKKGLVSITSKRGEIKVATEKIDCDEEKIFILYYTVIATDCKTEDEDEVCHKTEMGIEIEIIDVNDNTPMSCLESDEEVEILEGELKTDFINVCGSDADRDGNFHTITYAIDTNDKPELKDKFAVDKATGMVSVIGDLDRETQDVYTVVVFMEDNEEGFDKKSNRTSFKVILLDVNDEYPVFDSSTTFQTKSERTEEDVFVGRVHAVDKDGPGPNSTVVYSLVKVIRIDTEEIDVSDYFKLIQKDESGEISTAKSTDYLYGDINFYVKAEDKGTPPLSADEPTKFTMVLDKFNYKEPEIIKPKETVIALKSVQEIGKPLVRYNGDNLELFEIDNDQPDTKWDITFKVNDTEFFEIVKKSLKTAELRLKKDFDKEEYTLKVTATDNSLEQKSDSFIFTVLFVDENTEPVFNITSQTKMSFIENTTELQQDKIPDAYIKWQNITQKKIYYFLHEGDAKVFKVEDQNVIVISVLDREVEKTHEIKVSVSRINAKPVTPNDESILTIHIDVEDINDNPPNFDRDIYLKGINADTEINKELFKLKAIDEDTSSILEYNMIGVPECTKCNTELESITDPFSVEQDGSVIMGFKVKSTMTGYFTFAVGVTDGMFPMKSQVNIYVVSDINRVIFKFDNTINEVENKETDITKIFSQFLENECSIDKIDFDVDDNNKPINNRTKVDTNFIKDNVPVDADIIRAKANQIPVLVQMQAAFKAEGLTLNYVDGFNPEPTNLDRLLSTVLIVVSAVLGTLCIILFAAFVIRTKSLNKRLELLSTTKFGSQSSNLNRINCPAPNTNLYAVEGTNPVYGDDTNIDNHSVGSGDSEFIGIEDNPEFTQSRASFNPVMRDDYRRGSINPITIGAKENNNNNTINENNDDIMF